MRQIYGFELTGDEKKSTVVLKKAGLPGTSTKYKEFKGNEMIWVGEKQIPASDIGSKVIAVTMEDIKIQSSIKEQLFIPKGLIKKLKLTAPPDDSSLILYVGFDDDVSVNLTEDDSSIKVNFNKK